VNCSRVPSMGADLPGLARSVNVKNTAIQTRRLPCEAYPHEEAICHLLDLLYIQISNSARLSLPTSCCHGRSTVAMSTFLTSVYTYRRENRPQLFQRFCKNLAVLALNAVVGVSIPKLGYTTLHSTAFRESYAHDNPQSLHAPLNEIRY
jgi:hypothetical protein